MSELLVFLGPSLPAAEAKALAKCLLLPPARQGDVWRALTLRPKILVLIDGLFELQPSVWHRELLTALDSGITVFGASSMGALRAAELDQHGMVGIGEIYQGYASGQLIEDAEVALLHASSEEKYRSLTVPLVQVRYALREARKARQVSASEETTLIAEAEGIFYQERAWPLLFRRWAKRLTAPRLTALKQWLGESAGDIKASDARACLRAAEAFRRGLGKRGAGMSAGVSEPRGAVESSLSRRARLHGAHAQLVKRLMAREDAAPLAERGRSRQLLAGWARSVGFRISPSDLAQARREFQASSANAQFAAIDPDELERLLADDLLEARALEMAPWLLTDGPGPGFEDALAAESRLAGLSDRD